MTVEMKGHDKLMVAGIQLKWLRRVCAGPIQPDPNDRVAAEGFDEKAARLLSLDR